MLRRSPHPDLLVDPGQPPHMNFPVKETSTRLLLGFVAVNLLYFAAVNRLWLALPSNFLEDLQRATGGLVTQTLVLFLVPLAVLVFGWLVGIAKLRPADLGLRRDNFLRGAAGAAAVWALVQGLHVVAALMSRQGVELRPGWTTGGLTVYLGSYLTLLAGNALYEEIAFRGFLLPQLMGKLARASFYRGRPATEPLALALVLSQLAFAVVHLPGNYWGEMPWTAAAAQWLFGILLALVFLLTRNLWFCAGVHALLNGPPSLVKSPLEAGTAVLLVLSGLVLAVMLTRPGKAWLTAAARRCEAPVPQTT
jgi:hypothetical protein